MSTFEDLSDSEVLAVMDEDDDLEIGPPTIAQSTFNGSTAPPLTTQKPPPPPHYRPPGPDVAAVENIKLQLQKAESARDMYRGEVAVLRSNMERSSQAHLSQIKTVRETLTFEKQEQEQELENVKRELEALKSERAFFQNDLLSLQQKNKSLERRLHDQQIAAARLKQQQKQQQQQQQQQGQPPAQVQSSVIAEEHNNDDDDDLFVGAHNNNHSAGLPPTRKRPRQNLPDSFMDGFVLSPSQGGRETVKRPSRKPNIRLLDSSSEKSSNKSSLGSQQQPQHREHDGITHNNNIGNECLPGFGEDVVMIDEIQPQMESTRVESASNSLPPPPPPAAVQIVRVPVVDDEWKPASETEKIFEFTSAILGHQVAGVPEPTLDFLSRFCVQIGDTPGRRPVNTILQAALLPTCADGNGENRSLDRAVFTFTLECVRVLYACTENLALLHAVPMVLLVLHRAVQFAPSAIAKATVAGDSFGVVGFMNYLVLYYTRQLFSRKQQQDHKQFPGAGFNDTDDTSNNGFDDESEDQPTLTYHKIYLYYTVLHALAVLDLIASSHAGTDVPDDENTFWQTVSHMLFVELLSAGTTVPAPLLLRVVMLGVSSIRPASVGSLDYLSVSGENRAQKRARIETQLFYVMSNLLLLTTPATGSRNNKKGENGSLESTAKYLFFVGIDELVPSAHYIPFSTFYQPSAAPATAITANPITSASAGATTNFGTGEPRYLWNQVFRLPQLDRAIVSLQAAAVKTALQRCTLQFFATVLNTLNPRTIYGNDFIVAAIITCMTTTLDRLYARVGCINGGDSSGDSSNDGDVLLVSDCVRLLHGTMRLSPDYVGLIAGLPGGASYDHFVSLVRLQFESPAAIIAADDDENDNEGRAEVHEKSNRGPGKGIGANQHGPADDVARSPPSVFDAETLRKVQELLENTLTEEEANELYASDMF
jgi:hypothetical protein